MAKADRTSCGRRWLQMETKRDLNGWRKLFWNRDRALLQAECNEEPRRGVTIDLLHRKGSYGVHKS